MPTYNLFEPSNAYTCRISHNECRLIVIHILNVVCQTWSRPPPRGPSGPAPAAQAEWQRPSNHLRKQTVKQCSAPNGEICLLLPPQFQTHLMWMYCYPRLLSGYRYPASITCCASDAASTPLERNSINSLAFSSCFLIGFQDSTELAALPATCFFRCLIIDCPVSDRVQCPSLPSQTRPHAYACQCSPYPQHPLRWTMESKG